MYTGDILVYTTHVFEKTSVCLWTFISGVRVLQKKISQLSVNIYLWRKSAAKKDFPDIWDKRFPSARAYCLRGPQGGDGRQQEGERQNERHEERKRERERERERERGHGREMERRRRSETEGERTEPKNGPQEERERGDGVRKGDGRGKERRPQERRDR